MPTAQTLHPPVINPNTHQPNPCQKNWPITRQLGIFGWMLIQPESHLCGHNGKKHLGWKNAARNPKMNLKNGLSWILEKIGVKILG